MIAITFALPAESIDLIDRLRDAKRTARGNFEVTTGKIDDRDVEVLHTGVGRRSCQARIENFLDAERFEYLISAGFAGAVSECLQVGDLLLGENFSDRQLLAKAQQRLINHKVRAEKLFTSTSIVDSIAERNEIAGKAGAAAVDMETEVIAGACVARSIPMLSLRVISDSLRSPLPAPPRVLFDLERQRTNPIRFAGYFLTHPMRVSSLLSFVRNIGEARKILADAITAVATAL
jgi:nucleoside phosphorylase